MTAQQYLSKPLQLKKKTKTYTRIAQAFEERNDQENKRKFLNMANDLQKQADEQTLRILRLLARLSPLHADALKYRYLLGLTVDEIADCLCYTKRHTTRILKKALEEVEEIYIG